MMRPIALLLACSLVLAGCAGLERSIFQGGSSLTAEVANPVSRNTLAQIESAYGIAVSAAVAYRRLPLCRAGETASLARICAQRSVILALQSANRKARIPLLAARRLVRDHPTVNALDVIRQAREAVDEFRALAETTARG